MMAICSSAQMVRCGVSSRAAAAARRAAAPLPRTAPTAAATPAAARRRRAAAAAAVPAAAAAAAVAAGAGAAGAGEQLAELLLARQQPAQLLVDALAPAASPSPQSLHHLHHLLQQLPLLQLQLLQAPQQLRQPQPLLDAAEGLELPIQLLYLTALLGFLSAGAYLVVRQVLIRRELDEAAKALGERIRTGEATCEDYYELGVILTRKKLYTQATKNLEKAKKTWDGEEADLAQVHNALGFCYFSMEKTEQAIAEYRRAVELQAGYVTAWNNLGDAYERTKQWRDALAAYQEALAYAPSNKIAMQRAEFCRGRVDRLGL